MEHHAIAKQPLHGTVAPAHVFARRELYITLTTIAVLQMELRVRQIIGRRVELYLVPIALLGTPMQVVPTLIVEKHVLARQDTYGVLAPTCANHKLPAHVRRDFGLLTDMHLALAAIL